MNPALKSLPGVYFETVSPRSPQVLPRMDIAAFVGFAQKGPFDTPVPIEDSGRFREIFGDDTALAWDTDRGDYEYSYLSAAVSTFFRNGGRRCWVVRVADKTAAVTHQFKLPGLICIGDGAIANIEAHVSARSPGSWSRLLRVGSALAVTQLFPDVSSGESVLDLGSDGWAAKVTALPRPMYAGDLLEVGFEGSEARLFLLVLAIERNLSQGIRLSGRIGYWLYRDSLPGPPVDGVIESVADGYHLYPLAKTADLGHPASWNPTGSPPSSRPRIRLLRFELQVWHNGLLQHRFPDLAFHPDHPRFWGHLPADEILFASHEGKPSDRSEWQVKQLIEQASQPRFPLAGATGLWDKDFVLQDKVFLPFDMGFTPDLNTTLAANPGYPDSLAQQDGLEFYTGTLFLDPNLLQVNSTALLGEAENRAYIRNPPEPLAGIYSLIPNDEVTLVSVPDAVHQRWDFVPPPRQPGLQAPVLEEVPAASDDGLILLKWSPVGGVNSYCLQQDNTPEFTHPESYEIRGDSLLTVGDTPEQIPPPPAQFEIAAPRVCPENRFFRVRAEYLGEVSFWSNSRARRLPATSFAECSSTPPQLLEVVLNPPAPGSPPDVFNLSWQPAGAPFVVADTYQLQVATDIEFSSVEESIALLSANHPYRNETEGLLFFRVRAVKDETVGPWSNTVAIQPGTLNKLTLQRLDRFTDADLLAVHRCLLRLCAARADMLAVLTLPRHYESQQAIDHVARLSPFDRTPGTIAIDNPVPPLSRGESHALSYAAIYHPWVSVTIDGDSRQAAAIRAVPADGIVVGSMARVAADSGAWIAPANDLFTDVVALDQKQNYEQKIQLLSSQINLLEQDERGFLLMNADTLSERDEYRLINVRRLMILIRRLALIEGQRYVFEPNSGSFRDRVQNQFEGFMFNMFVRGAFSGATPQQAFRVISDRSVNTERRLDRGQLVIELQVAPSKPMSFLAVRLVQSGLNQLAVQEL